MSGQWPGLRPEMLRGDRAKSRKLRRFQTHFVGCESLFQSLLLQVADDQGVCCRFEPCIAHHSFQGQSTDIQEIAVIKPNRQSPPESGRIRKVANKRCKSGNCFGNCSPCGWGRVRHWRYRPYPDSRDYGRYSGR